MEGFSEVSVAQKMDAGAQIKRFLGTVVPLMLAIMIITLSLPSIFMIVKFLACVGLVYLSYRMFMGFYIEWEYSFVTDEIHFAKIMNKNRRKDLFTCQLKDTVVLFKNTDRAHLSEVPRDAQQHWFVSQHSAQHYIWVVKNAKGKTLCIHFEPNETMLNGFTVLARGKAFV